MTPLLETHIYLDEKGGAWIKRAGVSVKQVVESLRQLEFSPSEVVRHYPYLMLSEVHAVLAYYYDHRPEIDAELERDRATAERLRAAAPASEVTQRVREAMGRK
jgi:uncharacterized protein (DUF433 family)